VQRVSRGRREVGGAGRSVCHQLLLGHPTRRKAEKSAAAACLTRQVLSSLNQRPRVGTGCEGRPQSRIRSGGRGGRSVLRPAETGHRRASGCGGGMAPRSPVRSSPRGSSRRRVRTRGLAECLHLRPDASRAVDLLRPTGDLGVGAGNSLWLVVDRPDEDSFAAVKNTAREGDRPPRGRRSRAVLGHAARLAQVGQARALDRWRCSGPRLRWDSAMRGRSSSLASSLSDRESRRLSACRLSHPLGGVRGHQRR